MLVPLAFTLCLINMGQSSVGMEVNFVTPNYPHVGVTAFIPWSKTGALHELDYVARGHVAPLLDNPSAPAYFLPRPLPVRTEFGPMVFLSPDYHTRLRYGSRILPYSVPTVEHITRASDLRCHALVLGDY